MSVKAQHVVPSGDGWAVIKTGSSRASALRDTQKEAIIVARELAKRQHTELYIHGEDGRIRSRDSYGRDPFPPKG